MRIRRLLDRFAILALAVFAIFAQANPVDDIFSNKSSAEQKTYFAKLLRDRGESCVEITRLFYRGKNINGDAYWAATCSNAVDWNFRVPANRKAKIDVIECSLIKAASRVDCFKKFVVKRR